ncbi:MAG: hypothetical protein R3D00_04340 [Bacteroidia bacterium]
MEENKKKTQLTAEEKRKRIQELAASQKETASPQLSLDLELEDEDGEFDTSVLRDTQNPELSYKLYYEIRRLLMSYLPKGSEHKKLRGFIYEEKNIFLNRGKQKDAQGFRGSDGRMSYISSSLEIALEAVKEWIKTGPEPTAIWEKFNELNEKFKEEKDETS